MGGSSSKSLKEVVEILLTTEIKKTSTDASSVSGTTSTTGTNAADDKANDIWDQLWTLDISTAQIQTDITPAIGRRLISKQQGNTRRLFKQAIAQLSQVIETPFPIYFQQALTCSRILARLVPLMLETEHSSEFIMNLLWNVQVSKKSRRVSISNNTNDGQHPEIDNIGTTTRDNSPVRDKPVKSDSVTVIHKSSPFANVLINCILQLCFLPEFTIPNLPKEYSPEEMEGRAFNNAVMWAAGVGSFEKTVVSSPQYDLNRIDILKLLLSVSCSDVYKEFRSFDSVHSNVWLKHICSADVPYAEVLLYSLLNTVLGTLHTILYIILIFQSSLYIYIYCIGYDPIGWGLPFTSYVTRDTAKGLLQVSLDTLLVLLNYGLPPAQLLAQQRAATVSSQTLPLLEDLPGFNVFRYYLARIRKRHDFYFIFRGFLRLLSYIASTVRPSTPVAGDELELRLLFLLWRLIDENASFQEYVIAQENGPELWCVALEVLLAKRYFKQWSRTI